MRGYIFHIFFSIYLLNNLGFNKNLNAQSLPDDRFSQKQFAFKTLTINDGLSQNSVISIAQDSIGYLWLATQDGLNKYDGQHVTHYDKQFEDITRSNYSKLGKVYIDKQNKLWIITHPGKLELFDNTRNDFTQIPLHFKASTLFQNNAKQRFVGAYDNGLFTLDANTKTTKQLFKNTDTTKTVNDITELNQEIYISTTGSVFKLNPINKSYTALKTINTKPINFSALTPTPEGDLWIGSYGDGLFLKPANTDSLIQIKNDKIPLHLNIEDILIDKKNRLWIATYGHGVFLMQNEKVFNFKANKNNPFAIHYNDMLCLLEDNTGNIWFGSDGTGASYYDAHLIKFNIITNNQVPKSVNVDMVRAITTSKTGDSLWIGTSGKGLTLVNLRQNTYKTITAETSKLSSNRVISLSTINNNLWIGHQGYGLNIKEGSNNYISYPELESLTIWRIVPYKNNQAWLCTENNGIILFDKSQGIIKQFNTKNSALPTNHIKTVCIDYNNDIWIGSDSNGLFKLNSKTNQIETIKQIPDKIKSLYIDANTLWIGTNGDGLKSLNTITYNTRQYTTKDGLPNQVVYGILPDNMGNLWLSTNNGLSKFNTQSKNHAFENFGIHDGLQAREFNTGAYYKAPNGLLFFGGLEGVNWFHPNQLSYNTIAPKTIISKFEVFSKPQPLLQNTKLPHFNNTVTFTFSALHFSQPKLNSYKYQLLNHDKTWIKANHSNIAHYTNLPPNTYTFKVISSNYDGVWNPNPATYTFTIKQPWYLSNLAFFVYSILTAFLILGIYKYLKWRWNIKMQLQFEHDETERLKELDAQKTKLYTNISHEFRTPLTLISGPLEKQLNNPKLNLDDKQDLNLAHRSSKRLLNLVNQMLDLSKLETGNLTLQVTEGDLNALLTQIIQAFQFKAKEKNMTLTYNLTELNQVWLDTEVFEKIITNLLGNAVKYTPENGTIYIQTQIIENHLSLSITNTCNAINTNLINKWFDRYYQGENNTDGVGIGLSLVKELTSLYHGDISVNHINENQIQFKLKLPIYKSSFLNSEIQEHTKSPQLNGFPYLKANNTSKTTEKLNLLIVEDDEDIRLFIVRLFKSQFNIYEANNGKEGIKLALSVIPDIIISDLMMPKTDGIILSKTLKSDQKTSHIPIVLLTAKSGFKNEIEGLQTGADDYIVKPFNTDVLQLKINNLIKVRQQLQHKYSTGTALLDLAQTPTEKKFFTKLNEVLKTELTNPDFNVQTFSKHMYMSRMQLHRKLKATTGYSATEFIRIERLKIAKQLVLQGDLSIAEISYEVGFNSPSYFIKCFKKAFNCTPSELQA